MAAPRIFFRISRSEEKAREDFLKIFGSVAPPAKPPLGEMGFAYENINADRAVQAAFRIERLDPPPRRSVAVAVRAGCSPPGCNLLGEPATRRLGCL